VYVDTRRALEIGGVVAGAVLIVFGVVAIVMGVSAYREVRDSIQRENITATPDAPEITDGELEAGEPITTGSEARAFADIMRHHALAATDGQTYAEMGRFVDEDGNATNDEGQAARDETGRPVENQQRQIWVTQTALATALNMSYMAEQLAIFGLVVGVALLLAGIGFVVLALGGALRRSEREPV
jgi:hypothetical protein